MGRRALPDRAGGSAPRAARCALRRPLRHGRARPGGSTPPTDHLLLSPTACPTVPPRRAVQEAIGACGGYEQGEEEEEAPASRGASKRGKSKVAIPSRQQLLKLALLGWLSRGINVNKFGRLLRQVPLAKLLETTVTKLVDEGLVPGAGVRFGGVGASRQRLAAAGHFNRLVTPSKLLIF